MTDYNIQQPRTELLIDAHTMEFDRSLGVRLERGVVYSGEAHNIEVKATAPIRGLETGPGDDFVRNDANIAIATGEGDDQIHTSSGVVYPGESINRSNVVLTYSNDDPNTVPPIVVPAKGATRIVLDPGYETAIVLMADPEGNGVANVAVQNFNPQLHAVYLYRSEHTSADISVSSQITSMRDDAILQFGENQLIIKNGSGLTHEQVVDRFYRGATNELPTQIIEDIQTRLTQMRQSEQQALEAGVSLQSADVEAGNEFEVRVTPNVTSDPSRER